MVKKDVLEELSYSLSEKERNILLERINKSIEQPEEPEQDDDAARKERDRNNFIENELQQLTWLRKFFMKIRCRLTGRKIGEIVIEHQMTKLKKSISRRQPGITGFESRNLSPEFGKKVFDIYSLTFSLREMYRKLWLEPGVYESCCLFIMRSMYENSKNQLDEFITIDEMVDMYSKTGKREDIIKESEGRIFEYIESIPDIIFSEIEQSIAPIYKLKELILFHYTALFQKFSFTQNRSGDGQHFFKNASAMLCLDHLKDLYIAIMSAAELDEHIPINKFLIEYLNSLGEDDVISEDFHESFKTLILSAKIFARNMPLLEIIQYFRKEPYLRIEYSLKRKSFKDFYRSILQMKAKDEVLKSYPEIQKEYIEREITRIFKGQHFQEFRNYRMYASIDHQKMGLPFFTHTKSLNILYNYIKCFYQSLFSDVISILEKGILSQNRITRDRLMTHSVALQELEDKINMSDRSLAPEAEDGKLFHKLRMTLVSEPSQQRMYRTLVVNKNREVKSLIDWGEEALAGLEKIFNELVTSESNAIKVQLNKHYLMKGKSITLVSILKERANHIREFRRVLAQIIKLEMI